MYASMYLRCNLASSISSFGVRFLFAACLFHKALQVALDAFLVKYIDKSLTMSSSNLQEIYELHLPFSLIIPVFVLLLNARTTLCVARARVHLEKVIELNRFVRICGSNYSRMQRISKLSYHQHISTHVCINEISSQKGIHLRWLLNGNRPCCHG